mgnify:FL=1
MGYGLVSKGAGFKREGMKGLNDVAVMEEKRNMQNQQIESAEKQSKAMGAGTGAAYGFMVGGPVGALVGGVAGWVLS